MASLSLALAVVSIAASVTLALTAKGPKVEGPRLGDTKVTTSTYGVGIPVAFGRVRMGGNLIWVEGNDLIELRRKEDIGGKGGGGSQTVYDYFATMAVMFADNEATGITRIWANKKLIYDRTGASPQVEKYPRADIRIYLGTATQAPDPSIEDEKGVDSTPAYRGRTYVVFELLPLADFGNSIPQIEAEVQFKVPNQENTTSLTAQGAVAVNYVDYMRSSFQLYGLTRGDLSTSNSNHRIFRLDLRNNDYVETSAFPFNGEQDLSGTFNPKFDVHPGDDGRLFVMGRPTQRMMVELNPWTLDLLRTWNLSSTGSNPLSLVGAANHNPSGAHTWTYLTSTGVEVLTHYVWDGEAGGFPDVDENYFMLIARNRLSRLGGAGGASGFHMTKLDADRGPIHVMGATDDSEGNLWFCGWYDSSQTGNGELGGFTGDRNAKLWKMSVTPFPDDGLDTAVVPEYTEFDLVKLDPEGRIHQPQGLVYDRGTNTLTIFGDDEPGGGSFDTSIIQIDLDEIGQVSGKAYWEDSGFDPGDGDAALAADDPDLVDFTPVINARRTTTQDEVPAFVVTLQGIDGYNNNHVKRGTDSGKILLYHGNTAGGNTGWVEYDARRFTFTQGVAAPPVQGGYAFWHKDLDTIFHWEVEPGGNPGVRFDRQAINGAGDTLDVIVGKILREVGLDPTVDVEFDAPMQAKVVDGYVLASQNTAREAIEPLAFTFLFDVLESDFKLKFRTRGTSSVRTIPQIELGAAVGEEGSDELISTRTQEVELPARVDITYPDVARDYQNSNQHAKRIQSPVNTQNAENNVSREVPIVMDAPTAKAAVKSNLFNAWAERMLFKWRVTAKHLDLDPNDVVTLSTLVGDFICRINNMEVGEAFGISAESVQEALQTFTVTVLGTDTGFQSPTVGLPGPTEGFLLDLPLLRDADSPGQATSGLYIAYGPVFSDWQGAILEKADVITGPFSIFDTSQGLSAWGHLSAAVPAVGNETQADGLRVRYPYQVCGWDDTTSITVDMVFGEALLASVTDQEVLNATDNWAVIIDGDGDYEVLGYANVQVASGVATLTRIRRGLRGSEEDPVRLGWQKGDRVVFLDRATLSRRSVPLTDISANRFYRFGSLNEAFVQAFVQTLALEANDLRPYPPNPVDVDVAAGAGRAATTINLTWTRRTRLGGEDDLLDAVLQIDDGEDGFIEFEVDLLNPAGTAVALSKTGLATNTVAFTASERTTAGYADTDAINVRIYQMSTVAAVGRGVPREVTI